jgi:lipopolysaccharide transport protein LptA
MDAADGRGAMLRSAGDGVARGAGFGESWDARRAEGHRRARRHSWRVRVLRAALPVIGVLITGSYLAQLLHSAGIVSTMPAISVPRITPADLTMHNPQYTGETETGGTYRVKARTARQDLNKKNEVQLTGIEGDLLEGDGTRTDLQAAGGLYNTSSGVLELQDSISVVSTDGLSAKLRTATVRSREGLITSKTPVSVSFPAGTITSHELTIRQKLREVTFVKNVVARLKPPPASPRTPPQSSLGTPPLDASATGAASPAPAPQATPKLFGATDQPVAIVASRLDIKDHDKQAIFTGNVRAEQASMALTAPELIVRYEGAPADAPGSGSPGSAVNAGNITQITAKGPVVMTSVSGDRVSCDAAEFDVARETARFDGNVVMSSGEDRAAKADRAEINQLANTILLEGQVRVQQQDNVLTGRKLFVDRSLGRTSLTAPPMLGEGPGRISARLVQKDAADAPKKAERKVEPPASALQAFRSDPGAPLDVVADSLDVDDGARVAVFRGDVEARQGSVAIRSAELKAFYSGSAGFADVTARAPADAGTAGAEPTSLTRAEARGSVVIESADGRKVTGDWARFDAKNNKIEVGGEVGLTQGSSLVRGTRLTIDLNTGESKIDTAPSKNRPSTNGGQDAVSGSPGGGWSSQTESSPHGTSTGTRPSAIFFPNEVKNGTPSKGAESPRDAAPGWSSQVAPPSPEASSP